MIQLFGLTSGLRSWSLVHVVVALPVLAIFLTARLRWRGLRNGLFVVLVVVVVGKLFWIPRKKWTFTALLAGFSKKKKGNHCSMSTKIVQSNACPWNSWKLLQRVHKNTEIQCLSTKLVEFSVYTLIFGFLHQSVLCLYCIALVSYQICWLNF